MNRWGLLLLSFGLACFVLFASFCGRFLPRGIRNPPYENNRIGPRPLAGEKGVGKKREMPRKQVCLDKKDWEPPAFFDFLDVNPFLQDPSVSGWWSFRVVMADSGRPCPGARVAWYPGYNLDKSSFNSYIRRLYGYEKAEAILSKGLHTRTDYLGVCQIPRPGFPTMVAARKGEYLGFSEFPFSVLYLEKAAVFTVQVQDKNGIPLGGVPLLARAWDEVGNLRDVWNGMTSESKGTSIVRIFPRRLGKPFGMNVQVLLAWPSPVAKGRWVSIDPPPREPIIIKSPETGRVLVRADWTEKRENEGPFWVELLPESTKGIPGKNDFSLWKKVEKGVALFPWVGLGLRLRVRVLPFHRTFGGGDQYSWAFWEGQGPLRPGETVLVNLKESVNKGFFFQAVDENGELLKKKRLFFETIGNTRGAWQAIQNSFGYTDEEGFFRGLFNDKGWERWFRVSLWPVDGKRPGEGAPSALIKVPSKKGPYNPFLGKITFFSPKRLIAGRVLDHRGSGISGAIVTVSPVGEKLPPSGGSYWVRSGAGGRFKILGNASSEVVVQAQHQDYGWTKPVLVSQNMKNLILRFDGTFEIQGVLILDRPSLARSISVYAFDKQGGKFIKGRPFYRKEGKQRNQLAFQVAKVRPGKWDLYFYLGSWKVGQIDGVDVVSGLTKCLVETHPMDLRGRIKILSFRLRRRVHSVGLSLSGDGKTSEILSPIGDGGRARKGFLFCFAPTGETYRFPGFFSGKEGKWTFPFPAQLDPQALWVTGFTPKGIVGKEGRGEILLLERGVPVRLEVDGPMTPLKNGYFLEFRLRPAFQWKNRWEKGIISSSMEKFLHKGGRLVHKVYVPVCGHYKIECHIKRIFKASEKGILIKLKKSSIHVVRSGPNFFQIQLQKGGIPNRFLGNGRTNTKVY